MTVWACAHHPMLVCVRAEVDGAHACCWTWFDVKIGMAVDLSGDGREKA